VLPPVRRVHTLTRREQESDTSASSAEAGCPQPSSSATPTSSPRQVPPALTLVVPERSISESTAVDSSPGPPDDEADATLHSMDASQQVRTAPSSHNATPLTRLVIGGPQSLRVGIFRGALDAAKCTMTNVVCDEMHGQTLPDLCCVCFVVLSLIVPCPSFAISSCTT
jgi:hypothetical protein